jgi:hypothetical protein
MNDDLIKQARQLASTSDDPIEIAHMIEKLCNALSLRDGDMLSLESCIKSSDENTLKYLEQRARENIADHNQTRRNAISECLEYFFSGKGDATLCEAPIHCGCRQKIAAKLREVRRQDIPVPEEFAEIVESLNT